MPAVGPRGHCGQHGSPTALRTSLLRLAPLAAARPGSAAARAAPLSVADAFKATPIVFMWLSPDGQRLLAHGFGVQGAPGVIVMDVATMTPASSVRSERGGWPLTARWLGSELIVVAMRSETQKILDASGQSVTGAVRTAACSPRCHPMRKATSASCVTSGYHSVARIDVREVGSTRILYAWPPGVLRQWLVDRDGVPRVVRLPDGRRDDAAIGTVARRPTHGKRSSRSSRSRAVGCRWRSRAMAVR